MIPPRSRPHTPRRRPGARPGPRGARGSAVNSTAPAIGAREPGPTARVLEHSEHPEHPYTRLLLASVPRPGRDPARLPRPDTPWRRERADRTRPADHDGCTEPRSRWDLRRTTETVEGPTHTCSGGRRTRME
ncbi:hypothetical protein GT354_38290 [Streptomyces sp. SID3343]|nr:hypothetical protein [Streptomyces sp. SID3343]